MAAVEASIIKSEVTMKQVPKSLPISNSEDSNSSSDYSNVSVASSSKGDDNSFIESDSNLSLLPEDVIREEKKCMEKTVKEFSKLAQSVVRLDENEKNTRYKHLMALLGKSSQYASYMSQKLRKDKDLITIEENKESLTLKEISRNVPKKRKATSNRSSTVKKTKMNDQQSKDVESIPSNCYKNDFGLIVSTRQPKLLVGGILRDYQLDGLEWLVTLYKNAINGILADEMGLGKTIQVIALLCHLREKKIYGPHLIIAPLTTLPNWISEFASFAPDIPVMLFHGNNEKRTALKREFAQLLKGDKTKIPVIVTSYEMPLTENKFFPAVTWCYSIVDEGHRLKNYQSMLSIELRKYHVESRLLLTGTPLQNNLTELWSLLNYLVPEIFDDLPLFEQLFDFSDLSDSEKLNQLIEKEKEEQIVTKMHKILEPFLLRRLKSDINIKLPQKKELLVYAPLTSSQEKLYKKALDKAFIEEYKPTMVNGKAVRLCSLKRINYAEPDDDDDFIICDREKDSSKETIITEADGKQYYFNIRLQNPAMMLRKIVNHPYLVKCPIVPGTRDMIIDEEMISVSGKMLVLDALLPKLKATGHKVLLFSYFKLVLDLIEDYAIIRKYKYVRLDGTTTIEDRLERIKQYQSDPETYLFLISTRAGGLGINLTAADTVIIFDSDWNPQVDLQAQDRCHRIGQTKPVVVYRLVTAGTIDQRIVDFATGKRKLEKLVVKKGKFKQRWDNKENVTINELQELLNSTDYKKIVHPNGLVLSDEQIEELLDRSDLIDS